MSALQSDENGRGSTPPLSEEQSTSLLDESALQTLFDALPGLFLVLLPDAPSFTIVAASELYLRAIHRSRKEVVGRRVAEVFTRSTDPVSIDCVQKVQASLQRVLATRQPDSLPMQQSNVAGPESEGYGPQERHWHGVNSPVVGTNGSVNYIIHKAEDVTERRKAEEALRHSEERLRLATDAAELGVWVWHIAEDRVTWENESLYQMFGVAHTEEPINATRFMADFAYAEDAPMFERAIAATLETGVRFHYLGRFHHGSGDLRWTELIGHLNRAPNGDPVRIVGTAADVTERKRSELTDALLARLDNAVRALTDPQEITRAAVRLLGEHLQADDGTYSTLEADEETFEIVGDYSRAGAPSTKGRFQLQMFGPAIGELMRANLPYVVEDIETDRRIVNVQAAYRQIGIRAMAAVPLHKAGRLVAAMGVHQLTPRHWRLDEIDLLSQVANRCWESLERFRVSNELREREHRYQFLAESIPQMVWTATSAGALDYVNKQGTEYFGVDQQALLGAGWTAWLHPEERERAVESWQLSLASGKKYETTFRLQRGSDSSWHWHLARALPLLAETGEVLQWFGTCTDIQDQKIIEADLIQANRQLEEFAYVAGHDLQEPLRMVNIYTQLLLRRFVGNKPEAQKYADLVQRGVQRMETLLRDLLKFSRAGHTEDEIGAVDLSAAFNDASILLKSDIEESGAVIHASPLPILRGDKQMIHVFQNLLSNALKYRKKEGTPEIHVSAVQDREGWTVSVRDNGIGFEPEFSEQIFGLFKRLHKHEYPGTGLGLAICQRIVERFGGRMWAEGRACVGASVHFWLPSVQED